MDAKTFAVNALSNAAVIAGTAVLAYVSVRLAQKIYGPIEVTIKDKK